MSHNNTVSVINDSVFHPSHLTEDRMLYFWVSGQYILSGNIGSQQHFCSDKTLVSDTILLIPDQVFNPMLTAAHHDGLFAITISRTELTVSATPSLWSVKHQEALLTWGIEVFKHIMWF